MISEREAVFRILDANFNRLREAIRVIEESERFFLENPARAASLKSMRDILRDAYCLLPEPELLSARESVNDLGRESKGVGEMDRSGIKGIVAANFKRGQEAARVIEEYAKMVNIDTAKKAKEIRFLLYDMERTNDVQTAK
ncbi:MAG: thiamine-phosphate pyrophosphorylase [Fibrobacteres bacterium]|nr:thiamine-phosphate pyrophosphorylase [Fibrobacterota bacterium]